MSFRARLAVALAAIVVASCALVADVTDAQGATACHALTMTINSNPRAEAPSTALGHAHATGNHYNSARTNGTWTWRADNNGGTDGDTADTHYGVRSC